MSEEGNVTSTPGTPAPTAAPSAPTEAPSSAAGSTPQGGDITPQAAVAAAQAQAWSPDWKYKFNGQEKELDEFFRPLAKDPTSLERLKDFIQRADAFDVSKPKLKTYEEKISQYEPVIQNLTKLNQLFEKGDHERVLSELGFSDDMILNLAKAKLDRMRMPEDQRKLYEQNTQVTLEKEELLNQTETYKSQWAEAQAQLTEVQLDTELGRDSYQAVREAYDKHHGSGAFKQLVISRGAVLVSQAGKHIPPSELVPMVAKEFAPFITSPAGSATLSGMPAPETQQAQPPQGIAVPGTETPTKPKVIPQVGRGSSSPAKTQIRSLDDLKKVRAAAFSR